MVSVSLTVMRMKRETANRDLLLTRWESSLLGRTSLSFQESRPTWTAEQTCNLQLAWTEVGMMSWPQVCPRWKRQLVFLYFFCPLWVCLFSPCPFFWTWQALTRDLKILEKHTSKQFSLLLPVVPGTRPAPCWEARGYTEVPQHRISPPGTRHMVGETSFMQMSPNQERTLGAITKRELPREHFILTCSTWAGRGPGGSCRDKMASELIKTSTSKVREEWDPGSSEAGGGWHPSIWGGFGLDRGAGWMAGLEKPVPRLWGTHSHGHKGEAEEVAPWRHGQQIAREASTAAGRMHGSVTKCTSFEIKGMAV